MSCKNYKNIYLTMFAGIYGVVILGNDIKMKYAYFSNNDKNLRTYRKIKN